MCLRVFVGLPHTLASNCVSHPALSPRPTLRARTHICFCSNGVAGWHLSSPPPLQSGEAIEGVATLHTCSNIVLQDCWAQGLQTAAVCSLNRFFCWNTHLLRFNRSLLAHSLTHSLIHTHTHTHSLTLFTHSHTRSLTHTKRAHTGACYRFGSRFHLLNRPFNPDDGNC